MSLRSSDQRESPSASPRALAGPGCCIEPVARRAARDASLGFAITALLGVLFTATELDLDLQALAYSPIEPHWPLGRREPWQFLYRFSTWPGVALAVGAAAGVGASCVRRGWARFRYPSLYLLLLFAAGPGLVVNVVGKALLGRPRPWELARFGGGLEFLSPFEPGPPGGGFSFLCGHCSMGFLFVGFFYLARGRTRRLALAGGLALGVLQGIGRLLQGAHFASDALLTGSLMFTLAAALSPLAAREPRQAAVTSRRPWRAVAVTAVLVGLVVFAFLFSTPVHEERRDVWVEDGDEAAAAAGDRRHRWSGEAGEAGPQEVRIQLERGDLMLVIGPQPAPLAIESRIQGFGFPKARAESSLERRDGRRVIAYRQELSRGFWEFHGTARVEVRESVGPRLHLATGDGRVEIDASRLTRPLLLRGSYRLASPGARALRPVEGGHLLAGEGEPLVVEIAAEEVTIRRSPAAPEIVIGLSGRGARRRFAT